MYYEEAQEKMRVRLIKWREATGMSQSELAKLIDRKRATVSSAEKGTHGVSMEYAYDVCEALSIPFPDLFRGLGSFQIVRREELAKQDLRTMAERDQRGG